MSYFEDLLKKIESKTAHVGIVGLGYVGLPLAVEFAGAGFTVTGIDIDEKKVAALMGRKLFCRRLWRTASASIIVWWVSRRAKSASATRFALLSDSA